MVLVKLIYCSQMTHGRDIAEIQKILKSSRENNPEREITGLLLWGSTYFLQTIEGRRTQVNELFHKIYHDKRHKNVILLSYSDIQERLFSEWSMAYASTSGLDETVLDLFPNKDKFDPYLLSASEASTIMQQIAKVRCHE